MTNNYAKDCGCGQRNCNKGWVTYNGSEYPCDGPKKSEASTGVDTPKCNRCGGKLTKTAKQRWLDALMAKLIRNNSTN